MIDRPRHTYDHTRDPQNEPLDVGQDAERCPHCGIDSVLEPHRIQCPEVLAEADGPGVPHVDNEGYDVHDAGGPIEEWRWPRGARE